MSKWQNKIDEASRREFMQYSAMTCFGLGIGSTPFFKEYDKTQLLGNPSAKNVIYLYMTGGMSHLDTFDPKPEQKDVAGPVKAIKTAADGVQISQYLPGLAKQMDKACIIRSLNSTAGAHKPGQYMMHTSYAERATIRHPAMGAWLMKMHGKTNTTLPGNVVIGGGSQHPGSGFMESKFAPLPIGDPKSGLQNSKLPRGVDEKRFKKRRDLAEKFNKAYQERRNFKQIRAYSNFYKEAVALMKSEDLAAFNINKEPEALREAYGENRFGQGCLLARRLIEHDVRYVEVNLGGWDTHNDNFERVEENTVILDKALSTLLMDLSRRGMLEETLVVVATEFGRTPSINARKGRDHHPKAFSGLLAGGGIKGGQVYGASDEKGDSVVKDKVSIQDFNATIAYALGIPLKQQEFSPSRRPFTVADKGTPVKDIF